MKVSILTENTVYRRGLTGEHGLSLLIEAGSIRLLFDTGQTRIFAQNAALLGKKLDHLDGIILSHGHYDHCGGLGEWLEEHQPDCPIYVSRMAFEEKYTGNPRNKTLRFIGIDWEKECCGQRLELTELGKREIWPDIFLLSGIPYVTDFEPEPELFWKGEGGISKDLMQDEQLLIIRDEHGLYVFAGCAHPGIINCLSYVETQFAGEQICGIFAGMHLKGCAPERLSRTIEALKERNLSLIVPMHCTGIGAIGEIRHELGENCVLAEVGKTIDTAINTTMNSTVNTTVETN